MELVVIAAQDCQVSELPGNDWPRSLIAIRRRRCRLPSLPCLLAVRLVLTVLLPCQCGSERAVAALWGTPGGEGLPGQGIVPQHVSGL